jgi:hypothetical protein
VKTRFGHLGAYDTTNAIYEDHVGLFDARANPHARVERVQGILEHGLDTTASTPEFASAPTLQSVSASSNSSVPSGDHRVRQASARPPVRVSGHAQDEGSLVVVVHGRVDERPQEIGEVRDSAARA